jgi:protein-S-isoprenylcysteine O-methyltransferase Ste14
MAGNGRAGDKEDRGTRPRGANPGLVRPPLVYLGAIALGLLLQLLWPARLAPAAVGLLLGAVAVLVAVALFVYAALTLRSADTPVPSNRPITAMVGTGPFGFSRNPIYLSFSLLLVGVAFLANSWWPLLTLMPAVALMNFVVIPREERYLEARFPSEYPPYKASVRRWL